MKIRTRIALLLAGCLVLAGVIVLVVNEAAIENAIQTDYDRFQTEFYAEIGVSRAEVERYLRENPDAVTAFDADAPILSEGRTLNDVFRVVQVRAQREEIERSRWYTALAIILLSAAAGFAAWLIARRSLRPARLIAERASAASASDLGQRVALEGPNDEMKELSKTFDDMLDRLERSFEAQRRFAAQASHELRTPLAIIRAETDLLEFGSSATPEQRKAVDRIRAAGTRADHLIASLLALSRAEGSNVIPRTIVFDELVGDVLAEEVRGQRWSRLRVDVHLDRASVKADPQLLECVVVNLIENAATHGRVDGPVVVTVGPDPAEPSMARLAVENAADPSNAEHVRAAVGNGRITTPAGGNGIGLSVVVLIVEALGGSVTVEGDADTVAVVVRIPLTTDGSGSELAMSSDAATV